MKALFCISNEQFIINDFKASDVEILIKIRSIKNRWRKDGEELIQDAYFKELEILEDDDIKILGNKGNEKQWEEKLKEALEAAEVRFSWFQKEQAKVKTLTEELNKLKEVSNGN